MFGEEYNVGIIVGIIWNTQRHSVGKMQRFNVLKRVKNIVTTGPCRVKLSLLH
jgi:hypothetical protein